jgi:hypothetical protein
LEVSIVKGAEEAEAEAEAEAEEEEEAPLTARSTATLARVVEQSWLEE